MSGLSFRITMPTRRTEEQVGRKRREELRDGLHDARNPGRIPTHTPIGTQMRLAIAISTATRSSVMKPNSRRGRSHRPAHRHGRTSPSSTAPSDADGNQRPRTRAHHRGAAASVWPLRARSPGARAPRLHARAQEASERASDDAQDPRAPHHGQRPRAVRRLPRLLFEPEPVGARDQRAKQQLVEDQNHDEHGADRPADGG